MVDQQAIEKLKELLAKAEAGEAVNLGPISLTTDGFAVRTDISFVHFRPVPPEIRPAPPSSPLLYAGKSEPSYEWRRVDNDPPGWEGGKVELKRASGEIVSAELDVDSWFDGESSHPVHEVTLQDGSHPSLFDFQEWRLAPRTPK